MLKAKKIPLRKCIVTNEQFPKMEMFRIVRTPEGNVVVDLTFFGATKLEPNPPLEGFVDVE